MDGKSTLKLFMCLKQRKGSGKKHAPWIYVTSKKEKGWGRGVEAFILAYIHLNSLKVLLA